MSKSVGTSKRAGYKRKSNKRIDVLGDQLKRLARKTLNKSKFTAKKDRAEAVKARKH